MATALLSGGIRSFPAEPRKPLPACGWDHAALYADGVAFRALPLPRNGVGRLTICEGETFDFRNCPDCGSTLQKQVFALTVFHLAPGSRTSEHESVEDALAWLASELPHLALRLDRSGDDFSWWIVDTQTGSALGEVTS